MKKDNNFQITKAQLNQIIKEEYAAMVKEASKAEKIKSRIKAINEELGTLPENLSEVEATGTKKVKSTGWTGAGEGDTKYGEKFEKIGSHLKEDDEIEGEVELGGEEVELGGEELGLGGEEMESDKIEMGYFEAKFAELGRELDSKMNGGESEESGESEEVIAIGGDMGLEVSGDDESSEEEVEEIEEVENKVEEPLNEDLEEPIEGDSPAQDSEARFNDYMEKDKHVKESKNVPGAGLLSEGLNKQRKTALNSELERMKALAKINK